MLCNYKGKMKIIVFVFREINIQVKSLQNLKGSFDNIFNEVILTFNL